MSTGLSSQFAWKNERFCLNFAELQAINSSLENALLFQILATLDVVALLLTFLVVCYEHWEHSAKRRAKRKKLKTTITKEYLRRLKIQHMNKERTKHQDLTEYQIDVQFPNRNRDGTPTTKDADIKEPTNKSKYETKDQTKEAEASNQSPVLAIGVEQTNSGTPGTR